MFQRCPKGSSSWPCRSPQNMSASGWRTCAPAATARAKAASASSTSSASTTGVPPRVGGASTSHLGELVRQVQQAAADPELDRHQPPVGHRDPAHLLRPERLGVEDGGAFRALDHDVRDDWHSPTVGPCPSRAPRRPRRRRSRRGAGRQGRAAAGGVVRDARGQGGQVSRRRGPHPQLHRRRGRRRAAPRHAGLAGGRDPQGQPDSAQLPVRQRALQDGKTVYMAVPRLAEPEPFFALDPAHLSDPPRKAASISGASRSARRVTLAELSPSTWS